MTEYDYRKADGISQSMLKDWFVSPAVYYAKHISLTIPPEPEKDSMRLGTAVHALVLEPQNFDSMIAVMPKCDRRTKVGKEVFAEFAKQSTGKTIIDEDQYATAKAMAAAIGSNKLAATLLVGAAEDDTEVVQIWEDQTGLWRKCRIDLVRRDLGCLIDVKTSATPWPGEFMRSYEDFGYFRQGAFYLDSPVAKQAGITSFRFIVVGSEPPHEVFVYEASEASLAEGAAEIRMALEDISVRRFTGEWTDERSNDLIQLDRPALRRVRC